MIMYLNNVAHTHVHVSVYILEKNGPLTILLQPELFFFFFQKQADFYFIYCIMKQYTIIEVIIQFRLNT